MTNGCVACAGAIDGYAALDEDVAKSAAPIAPAGSTTPPKKKKSSGLSFAAYASPSKQAAIVIEPAAPAEAVDDAGEGCCALCMSHCSRWLS